MNEKIKKLKNKIYEKKKNMFLQELTGNLGKVVMQDDNIICYASKNKIKNRNSRDPFLYSLKLTHEDLSLYEIEMIKKYDIDIEKPINYIFQDMVFDRELNISAVGSNIIFRECIFRRNIRIYSADKVTFENNKYIGNFYDKTFLYGRKIQSLVFKNDYFDASNLIFDKTLGINIDVDTLELNKSIIKVLGDGSLFIKANQTVLKNQSELKANEIYLDSKSIDLKDSSIIAKRGIMIENSNRDLNAKINSPIIIYNGINLHEQEDLQLTKKRQELLNILYRLKENSKEEIQKELLKEKEKLEHKQITKILKNISK